jgi:hypothetical protein
VRALPASAAPLAAVRSRPVAWEFLLIAIAALTYTGVRALTRGSFAAAEANAEAVLRIEGWLGIAWEEALQGAVIGHQWLVTFANWVYIWGHWPVIAVVAVLLYRSRRDRYYLLRNAIFVSGAIGFLFFAAVPTAPPRLLDGELVDTIMRDSSSYRVLQPPSLTNQYAAMPSLHFGWNLLVGIALFGATTRLAVRAVAVATPLAMALAVVVTANHFVLDVLVGGCVVLVGLAVVRRFGSHPGEEADSH